jgi:uncharacterized protein YbjT (DUF2867 family)/membrane protease YdiL (CAAX protease family)
VGIKRESGTQSFEQVHVEATRRLLDAARVSGIARYVHISVVCSRPDAGSAYHDTKWRAEGLVRESGLTATILRPGVIYGEGDDMLTHLVKMIRCASVFPVVGTGTSLLQPIDVRDVADAVVQTLERPHTSGRTYDLVGADRLELRRIVRLVADGLDLRTWIVPTPLALLRPVIRIWSALSASALSTPAQLRMLEDGMVGDPEPARRDLGLSARRFTAAAADSARHVPPLFGVSFRLLSSREERASVPGQTELVRGAAVALLGMLLLPLVGLFVPNVWYRLAVSGAVLTAVSLAAVRLPWRALFRPTVRACLEGTAAAAVLYALGAVVFQLIAELPAAASQMAQLYGWRDALPLAIAVPLLLGVVVAEEVVWRNAVTWPLVARFGAWPGVCLASAAFAAAHVSLGVPLLVVIAFAAGVFWSALVVRTRSALAGLVSHVLWDLAVMFVAPYRAFF